VRLPALAATGIVDDAEAVLDLFAIAKQRRRQHLAPGCLADEARPKAQSPAGPVIEP